MTIESERSQMERPEFQGFREYYEEEIAAWAAEQTAKMGEVQKKSRRIWLFGLPLVILAVLGLISVGILEEERAFFAVIIGLLVLFIWAQQGTNRLKKNMNTFLLDKICKFLNLRYSPDGEDFPFDRFRNAEMMPFHTRRSLSNSIFGSYAGVDFGLIGCRLKTRIGKSSITKFEGLLYMFTFPRQFQGRVLVTPVNEDLFAVSRKQSTRVVIDDPIFEKNFEVFATNKEEARQLLNPAVTALIGEFTSYLQQEQERSIASMAFLDHFLLLAVNEKSSPLLGKPRDVGLESPEMAEKVLEEINFVFEIINTLEIGENPGE